MHAELATPPALPHRASLPHSRHSVSTMVQLCGADFTHRTCFSAGVVDHVRPSPRPNGPNVLAAAISTNRSYHQAICHLPPADAMTDVTKCRFAENFGLIGCVTNCRNDRIASCEHRIINNGAGG